MVEIACNSLGLIFSLDGRTLTKRSTYVHEFLTLRRRRGRLVRFRSAMVFASHVRKTVAEIDGIQAYGEDNLWQYGSTSARICVVLTSHVICLGKFVDGA